MIMLNEQINEAQKIKQSSLVAKYLNNFYKKQGESKGRLIFRGQANKSWDVASSAGRRLRREGKDKQNEYIRYHINLIANARKNGYNKLEAGSKLSDLEVLAEIQHYGGATCLTDFSTNFLVALWFASQEYSEKKIIKERKKGKIEWKEIKIKTKGKVVWLDLGEDKNFNNISYYNNYKEGDTIQHLLTKRNQSFDLKMKVEPRFWLWEPTKLNNRIIKQDSVFLFGLPAFSDKKLIFNEIIVLQKYKHKIREELDSIFGINAETVFFDLTGYSNNANAIEVPVSEKILSNKPCLDNAKECIKKGQHSIAVGYLDEALICKAEKKGCKKNKKEPCVNNCIGELHFWRGEAFEGKKEDRDAILSYYHASKELSLTYEENKDKKILNLLCESYRKQSILQYLVKDYLGAINSDMALEKLYQTKPLIGVEQNGADSIFALIELSIFTFDKAMFEKYLPEAQKINPQNNNGEILHYFLSELGKAIFNLNIDLNNLIVEIENKTNDIINYTISIDSGQQENIENLIGYYYWNYNDTILWIEDIRSGKSFPQASKEQTQFITKHTSDLKLFAQMADEAQSKLYNLTFANNSAVEK